MATRRRLLQRPLSPGVDGAVQPLCNETRSIFTDHGWYRSRQNSCRRETAFSKHGCMMRQEKSSFACRSQAEKNAFMWRHSEVVDGHSGAQRRRRSEERRVGKECKSRRAPETGKKKSKKYR